MTSAAGSSYWRMRNGISINVFNHIDIFNFQSHYLSTNLGKSSFAASTKLREPYYYLSSAIMIYLYDGC